LTDLEQRTVRPTVGAVEERSAPEALAVEGRKLRGRIPYGVESRDLGGWKEIIEPGALRGADLSGLVARVDHAGVPVGRYPGTLELEDRDDGLRWSVELPESRADVREAVERGDLRSGSWRMVVGRDEWRGQTRHVHEIRRLEDVSVVVNPAYDSAAVELRAAPEPVSEFSNTPPPESEPVMDAPNEQGRGLTVDASSAPEQRSIEQPADIETRVLEGIRSVRKGESRSLTTTDASPIDTPELATYIFDKMRPSSVMLAAGIRVMTTDRERILWPRTITDVNPDWADEAVEIPDGDPGWDQLEVIPSKLAHRTILSNESIDDAPIDLLGWVESHIMKLLALKLDIGLLEGTAAFGTTGVLGLKNQTGTQQILTLGANGGPLTDLDPIAAAIAALEEANAVPSAIIMHPSTWFAAETLKDANHRYLLSPGQDPTQAPSRSLFGLPVFVSSQLSKTETRGTSSDCSSIYVLDGSQVVLVRRSDVQLEVDRSQYFSSDETQIRAKVRCGFVLPHPLAVARVQGVRS
jgi:HK97 family phage major capsid protein/HK97 family phage prohead protease